MKEVISFTSTSSIVAFNCVADHALLTTIIFLGLKDGSTTTLSFQVRSHVRKTSAAAASAEIARRANSWRCILLKVVVCRVKRCDDLRSGEEMEGKKRDSKLRKLF